MQTPVLKRVIGQRQFQRRCVFRLPANIESRTQLLNGVWGYDYDPGTNVLEVYVGYLRKKLGEGDQGGPIDTVRGAGYRLRANGA